MYKINFELIHIHKYSLTELEGMIPWEREILLSLILNYNQEKAKEEANRGN